MKMRQDLYGIVLMLIVNMTAAIPASTMDAENAPKQVSEKPYFAGYNLLSPFPAFLPVPGNTLFSVLSNLECGLGLSGGMIMKNVHAMELRLSLGPNSRTETIFNAQVYYNFYPMRSFQLRMKGLYVGTGLRYWDLFNGLTEVHRNNVAGEIDLGYRFGLKGSFYIDVRVSEIAAVYSWLSAEHTDGGWATLANPSLPKSPLFSIDVGIRL
jgi:hypothetical protein